MSVVSTEPGNLKFLESASETKPLAAKHKNTVPQITYNHKLDRPNRNKDIDPCGDNRPLITDELNGSISSPNYPQNYPNDANCSWMIALNTPSKINLTFNDFDVENDKQ